jgi:hypothetical protein
MNKASGYAIIAVFLGVYCYFLFKPACPVFPVGIYSATIESFGELKRAGFNCVQTYSTDPEYVGKFVEEAWWRGLKALIYPGDSINRVNKFQISDFKFQIKRGVTFSDRISKTVKRYKGNDAILAWYLVDEPDVSRIPGEAIREISRLIKGIDGKHPTALVIGQGKAAKEYAGCTDITMVDWYPIPHLPLDTFSKNIEETVSASIALERLSRSSREKNNNATNASNAINAKNAVFAVIQAFDWNAYSKKARERHIGRNPTYEEMRCMTYLAIIHGVNGVFYYNFSSGYKIKDYPEHWGDLKRIVRELRKLEPVLLGGSRLGESKFQISDFKFQIKGSGKENIHFCVKEYKGKRYLFAANASPVPVKAVFEGVRRDSSAAPQNDKITVELGAYGVLFEKIK